MTRLCRLHRLEAATCLCTAAFFDDYDTTEPVYAGRSGKAALRQLHVWLGVPLAEGDISPLRKVIAFASGHHVAKMRDLLLEHGAEETEEDRERWRICEKAWLCENIRLREALALDSRDYDPCGAAMERDM